MMQFAEFFFEEQIVVTLSRQLSWSHFLVLLPLKSKEAKLYYAQKSIEEVWGKRQLAEQTNKKAFEKTKFFYCMICQCSQVYSPRVNNNKPTSGF